MSVFLFKRKKTPNGNLGNKKKYGNKNIKMSLDGSDSRIQVTEEVVTALEFKLIEIIQGKTWTEKGLQKQTES